MDQNRSQVLKKILNGIVFISLFICFLFLYFINETNEFLKGSTTFATRTEEVNKFTVPVLVICFEPNYKPSIFGNGTADLKKKMERRSTDNWHLKLHWFSWWIFGFVLGILILYTSILVY